MPPSLLATALLLQWYDDVPDDEARDRAKYDLRWKVALGVEVEEQPVEHVQIQDWFDRQLDRLAADQNRDARELAEVSRFDREIRPEQDEKGAGRKSGEHRRLHVEHLPEDVEVPERVEPQHVDVIRQRRPTAQDNRGNDGEKEQAPAPPSRPPWWRQVDDAAIVVGHM